MRRTILLLFIVLMLRMGLVTMVAARPALQTPQRIDGIAAVVNKTVFSLSAVRAVRELRLVDPSARQSDADAALALVQRHLMLEEAARLPPSEPSADAIAERRRVWTAQLPSGFNLPAALDRYGWTEDDLKAWLVEDVRIENCLTKLFAASAQPTTKEIADYVSLHQADLVRSGVAATPEALEAAARRQLAQINRQARIRDWIDGLTRRAEIDIKIK